MNKEDQAFCHLPETYTLLDEENTFVKYVLMWIKIMVNYNCTNDLTPPKVRKNVFLRAPPLRDEK